MTKDVTTGSVCLVTELCSNGSIRDLIKSKDFEWTWDLVVSFALDVAMGMHYLHRLATPPLVHRDLKSANLLVNDSWRVKIADFGLAKLADVSKMRQQSLAGTYQWMAPEMMEGRPYNEKVDVYSFGIVLWELCSKRLPFTEFPNEVALSRAVVDRGVRPPIPRDTPRSLAELMVRCWQPDHRRRPSFNEIKDELLLIHTFSDPRQTPTFAEMCKKVVKKMVAVFSPSPQQSQPAPPPSPHQPPPQRQAAAAANAARPSPSRPPPAPARGSLPAGHVECPVCQKVMKAGSAANAHANSCADTIDLSLNPEADVNWNPPEDLLRLMAKAGDIKPEEAASLAIPGNRKAQGKDRQGGGGGGGQY